MRVDHDARVDDVEDVEPQIAQVVVHGLRQALRRERWQPRPPFIATGADLGDADAQQITAAAAPASPGRSRAGVRQSPAAHGPTREAAHRRCDKSLGWMKHASASKVEIALLRYGMFKVASASQKSRYRVEGGVIAVSC